MNDVSQGEDDESIFTKDERIWLMILVSECRFEQFQKNRMYGVFRMSLSTF